MAERRSIKLYSPITMKHRASEKLCSFVQIALVSMFILNIPTAQLQASDVDSGSGPSGELGCEVSEGDKAFGIQVIFDVACAGGGLGCYSDHCRYCKVVDTFKSTHLESCGSFGASFPIMAPLTPSKGACLVSSGDAAVGVGGMTDLSCLYGGIGCFNDHCRFCQSEFSPQSSLFLLCSWVKNTNTGSDILNDFAGDYDADKLTKENSAVAGGYMCTLTPSYGNIAVGIDITSDASCSGGGVGCIDNICRFCKSTDTAESVHLIPCPSVTVLCSTKVSDGDAAVGISIATDASCAQGGVGCIDSKCRFCRKNISTQSAAYVDCALIGNTTAQTPVTTLASLAPSLSPALTPSSTAIQSCSLTVSEGDAAVGINVVTDTGCIWGGLGCIDQSCRFCRVTTSIQSEPFVDCASIVRTMTAPVSGSTISIQPAVLTTSPSTKAPELITPAPTKAPVAPTKAPITTKAPEPRIPASTKPPVTGTPALTKEPTTAPPTKASDTARPTQTPALTTLTPTSTPTSTIAALTRAPTSTSTILPPVLPTADCNITAAAGDLAVGVDIVTDISCVSGGLGCINSVCRFCRVKATTQSAVYVDCAIITSITHPLTPALTTPTLTPTPTIKSAATPIIVFLCSRAASGGDKDVGLDIVSDVRCSEGGTGCLDEVCRFCKRFDTVQSQTYINCSSIPSSDIGSDITFVQIPIVNDKKTLESAGIISKDKSMQVEMSTNTIVTLQETAAVETEMDYTCANVSLADGQAAGGIGVVLDTINCPKGLATGCVGSEGCRYCMRFPTSVSEMLDYCAVVNSSAVAYALSGLFPFSHQDGTGLLADTGNAEPRVERVTTSKAIAINENEPQSMLTEIRKWFAVAGACFGVVILVSLVTYRLYRLSNRQSDLGASSTTDKRISSDNNVVVMSNSIDHLEIIDE
ncbi:hypothetical protein Plhal703r1_c02g0009621 [Plasmopara halstedii]